MDQPELSLGPYVAKGGSNNRSSVGASEAEMIYCRKRKCNWDEPITHSSIELQLKNPLPLDWEQCLDLQSGRMYYLNRRTLKKSWDWPRDQKLDLELNISPSSIFADRTTKIISASTRSSEEARKIRTTNISHTTNMVAVACIKCHLLVMLCKSSPACPNCKYVHSLSSPAAVAAVAAAEAPAMVTGVSQQVLKSKMRSKSLETLSLLN